MKTLKKKSAIPTKLTRHNVINLLKNSREALKRYYDDGYNDDCDYPHPSTLNFLKQTDNTIAPTDLIPFLDSTDTIDRHLFRDLVDLICEQYFETGNSSEAIKLFQNDSDSPFELEPWVYPTRKGNSAMALLSLFLEHGTPQYLNWSCWSELAVHATKNGNKHTVLRLLEKGFSLEKQGYSTPAIRLLDIALANSQTDLAQTLIDGLTTSAEDSEHLWLLQSAANYCPSCVPSLLKIGPGLSFAYEEQFNSNPIKDSYSVLLSYAAKAGDTKLANLLVTLGTPVTDAVIEIAKDNLHHEVEMVLTHPIYYRAKAAMKRVFGTYLGSSNTEINNNPSRKRRI